MTTPHDPAPCPGFVTDLVLRCAREDGVALGQLYDLVAHLVIAEVGDGRDPGGTGGTDALVVATFRRVWLESRRYVPGSQDVVGWVLDQARTVSGGQPRDGARLVAT